MVVGPIMCVCVCVYIGYTNNVYIYIFDLICRGSPETRGVGDRDKTHAPASPLLPPWMLPPMNE